MQDKKNCILQDKTFYLAREKMRDKKFYMVLSGYICSITNMSGYVTAHFLSIEMIFVYKSKAVLDAIEILDELSKFEPVIKDWSTLQDKFLSLKI